MHQALRRLVEVPLQMADQARAVIHHPEQHGLDPGPRAVEHLARAVMEVQVPERADVIDLEASDLKAFEPVTRHERALGGALRAGLPEHALGDQEAPDGGVGRHGRVAGEQDCAQVVEVQLHGPARMLAVLAGQDVDGVLAQAREAPGLGVYPASEDCDRIARRARGVIPALDGGNPERHVQPRDRMTPGLGRERAQRVDQAPRCGWRGHQGADDREAQARPAIAQQWIGHRDQGSLPNVRRTMRRNRKTSLQSLAGADHWHVLRVASSQHAR